MPTTNVQVKEADLKSIDPLDKALEVMHFAFRGLTRDADIYLAEHGLTRVHHRILYVVARAQDLSVGTLCSVLGVSKQALHRPMKQLLENSLIVLERDATRPKYKFLKLTASGAAIERKASDLERAAMRAAFERTNPAGRRAWHEIMEELARRA